MWYTGTDLRRFGVVDAAALESQRGRRFLVVGDDGDAAALLAVLLQLEGHDVQTATDADEALERGEQFRPEVVLMDLEMPAIDGFEASRRIRAQAWGQNVLVAVLTGWGGDDERRRAREAGVDLHFIKPVDTALLLAIVTRSLNSARRIAPKRPAPVAMIG
jgi:DNA-binding response OmpR family regulator